MFKCLLIILLLICSDLSWGRSSKNKKHKNHKKNKTTKIKNATVYSMCSRDVPAEKNILLKNNIITQTIIIATETLSERSCEKLGQSKADQYTSAGWKCVGFNNELLFSCESEKAAAYAKYKGAKLDHLTFTNLQNHRSLLAYVKSNNNELCHEEKMLFATKDKWK